MKKNNPYRTCLLGVAIALFFTLVKVNSYAQVIRSYDSDTVKNVTILHPTFAMMFPGADMADRFGWHAEIGGDVWLKRKSNWIIGISGAVMFGENVKGDTNILDFMKNEDGGIIGTDGYYAEYSFFERGFRCPVIKVGKLFPVKFSNSNKNSGFFALAGVGFMQHKIRLVDHSKNMVQIHNGYSKGYDRLSNGLMITENFGYMYLGRNGNANFKISFECSQGFTKNRRSFNYDTRTTETDSRLDLLYGVKVAWCIPLYKKMAEGFYVN